MKAFFMFLASIAISSDAAGAQKSIQGQHTAVVILWR